VLSFTLSYYFYDSDFCPRCNPLIFHPLYDMFGLLSHTRFALVVDDTLARWQWFPKTVIFKQYVSTLQSAWTCILVLALTVYQKPL